MDVAGSIDPRSALIYLSRDSYWCRYDDSIVLLSLRGNRYFSLDEQQTRLFCSWIDECAGGVPMTSVWSSHPREAEKLLDLGVLTTSTGDGKIPCPTSLAVNGSVFDESREPPSAPFNAAELLALALSAGRIHYDLRHEKLRAALARVELRRSLRPRPCTNHLLTVVRKFNGMRPWLYTARERCLLDSLVLLDHLWRHGIQGTLAMGVRMRPFAAHAWIQVGSLVVNDFAENVKQYALIFQA